MSYLVIARKWRPQTFEDVVGQRAVTRTLRNALQSGRLAQAFVFAGPRGVGKTTTARILARALNCEKGPTPDPCGVCDACVEIAEGRDMDVLEIDAATHTGVDNIREVVIEGLALPPLRDRRKIFIIDEVHQLSSSSFNALLKSVEEPPPHVVFIMATTELTKIPDTILSRSQVFEFRTIKLQDIVEQLRTIAAAEGITVDPAALLLIARSAEGSMRDAQSAFDQVIAFAGERVDAAAVVTVLGLVSRDLLFDIADAVAEERAPAIFDLVGSAVERGYELKQICQELSKLVRDLMLVNVDPSRIDDAEVVSDADRERLQALAGRFSLEDLLRAFDVLARTDEELRISAQPRYTLEMGLLRWLHTRKLVPLAQLIDQVRTASGLSAPPSARPAAAPLTRPLAAPARPANLGTPQPRNPGTPEPRNPGTTANLRTPSNLRTPEPRNSGTEPRNQGTEEPRNLAGPALKEAFLTQMSRAKRFVYSTVAAQAQRIEVDGDRIVFTYGPAQRVLHNQLEQYRRELEAMAADLAGRPIAVVGQFGAAAAAAAAESAPTDDDRKARLTEQAKEDAAVQAMLDVFPAAIRDVEEIE
jgi:DNA polymerase-3 subunit gamma/tau